MWRQDFDGPAGSPPDPDVWVHEVGGGGWGDGQRQVYTASAANACLDGSGSLAITARQEPDGTITSARLCTRDRFATTYGRVAARMRMPAGLGTWSAFWMLGADMGEVGWPSCGEIDVVEHVGADPRRCHGTAHGPGWCGLEGGLGGTADLGHDLSLGFHEYGVVWQPHLVEWQVDGRTYHRLAPADVPGGAWPLDHPFYLLLNLAIGGAWPGNDRDEPELPATLLVDWVRVDPV